MNSTKLYRRSMLRKLIRPIFPVIIDFDYPIVQYAKQFFEGFMTLGIFATALEQSTANKYISEHRIIQAPFTSIKRKPL